MIGVENDLKTSGFAHHQTNLELLRRSRREKDLGPPGSPETLGHVAQCLLAPVLLTQPLRTSLFYPKHQASASLPLPRLFTAGVAGAESGLDAKAQAEGPDLSSNFLSQGPSQCPLTWGLYPQPQQSGSHSLVSKRQGNLGGSGPVSSSSSSLTSKSGGKIQGSEVTTEEGPGLGGKNGIPSGHLPRLFGKLRGLRRDRKEVRENASTYRGQEEAGEEKAEMGNASL